MTEAEIRASKVLHRLQRLQRRNLVRRGTPSRVGWGILPEKLNLLPLPGSIVWIDETGTVPESVFDQIEAALPPRAEP